MTLASDSYHRTGYTWTGTEWVADSPGGALRQPTLAASASLPQPVSAAPPSTFERFESGPKRGNWRGVVGLLLGVISAAVLWASPPVGCLFAVAGLGLSVLALVGSARGRPAANRWPAITGVILGAAAMIVSAVLWAA